jgi:hypothetical protein
VAIHATCLCSEAHKISIAVKSMLSLQLSADFAILAPVGMANVYDNVFVVIKIT